MAIAIFTIRLTVDDSRLDEGRNEAFVEELENEVRDRLDKVDTELWREADVIFEDTE